MISEDISNKGQQQGSEYLWTQNFSFLSAQQELLRTGLEDSPFMSCWKIFEMYNSGQTTTSNSEESEISEQSNTKKPKIQEVKERFKMVRKNKKINKKNHTKKLRVVV